MRSPRRGAAPGRSAAQQQYPPPLSRTCCLVLSRPSEDGPSGELFHSMMGAKQTAANSLLVLRKVSL
eukprot:scaffold365760_cov13-Prasinocladus_malaysianus.AAC.1